MYSCEGLRWPHRVHRIERILRGQKRPFPLSSEGFGVLQTQLKKTLAVSVAFRYFARLPLTLPLEWRIGEHLDLRHHCPIQPSLRQEGTIQNRVECPRTGDKVVTATRHHDNTASHLHSHTGSQDGGRPPRLIGVVFQAASLAAETPPSKPKCI